MDEPSERLAIAEAPKLVIYGHAAFDVSVVSGKTIRTLGGAAYYAAVGAAKVIRRVGVVTVIGADFPVEELRLLEIDLLGVAAREGSSAVFYQEYDSEGTVRRFESHLNVCEDLSPQLIPTSYLEAQIFFVATAPPGQQASVLDGLKRACFRGLVAIDTALPYIAEFQGLLRHFAGQIRIALVNGEEYRALDWVPPDTVTLVVKHGPRGANLRLAGVWVEVPAPRVETVRNTTGAGDILAGAFLAGVASGDDPRTALVKGVDLATKSVAGFGVERLRAT
jgi:sugar/nucleoside kinase (ribokinase family)